MGIRISRESAASFTVEDEGVALPARSAINFAGAGVSAADSGGKTVVTIAGGGGSGGSDGTVRRTVTLIGDPVTTSVFSASATNTLRAAVVVPTDYVSGDLTFKFFVRASVAGNTMVLRKSTHRLRSGAARLAIDTDVNIDISPADQNTLVISMTVAAANFQAGDNVRADLVRNGADASDTNTNTLVVDGACVEYLGRII